MKTAARLRWPAIIAAATMLLGGCSPSVLDPAGPVAASEKTILLNSLAIMLAIVVPTIIATLAFAWWFRAGNDKAEYWPDWSYSGRVELLVWSVPLLVIIFLGGIAWIASHTLDPSRPLSSKKPPLTVQVISLDWKWLFIYPGQDVASVNRLVLPVGTPVEFHVTSGTVMNSFFVPQLGSQIYAMAGMEAKLVLMADRPGTFQGISAHYSGEGFANMHFNVQAVSDAAFGAWTASARRGGNVLDGRSYLALAKNRANLPAFTYGHVAPGFFQAAVKQAGAPVHATTQAAGRVN